MNRVYVYVIIVVFNLVVVEFIKLFIDIGFNLLEVVGVVLLDFIFGLGLNL